MRLKENSLVILAPPCSSWVFMSRSTSGRSIDNPLGDPDRKLVAQGNEIISRPRVYMSVCWNAGVEGGSLNAHDCGACTHVLWKDGAAVPFDCVQEVGVDGGAACNQHHGIPPKMELDANAHHERNRLNLDSKLASTPAHQHTLRAIVTCLRAGVLRSTSRRSGCASTARCRQKELLCGRTRLQ